MRYEDTFLGDGHTPAACVSAMHVFFVFCMVYRISVTVTFVRENHISLVKVLVLTNDIQCKNISASSVDRLVIVHILLGLLALYYRL